MDRRNTQSEMQRQFLDGEGGVVGHSLPDSVDDLWCQFGWSAASWVVLGRVVSSAEARNPPVDSRRMQYCSTMLQPQPMDDFHSGETQTDTEMNLDPLPSHRVVNVIF